jgi:hypothetical protein
MIFFCHSKWLHPVCSSGSGMVSEKKKGSLKISELSEKIPGGKKGIKIIGIKLGIDIKRFQIFIRELQSKKF